MTLKTHLSLVPVRHDNKLQEIDHLTSGIRLQYHHDMLNYQKEVCGLGINYLRKYKKPLKIIEGRILGFLGDNNSLIPSHAHL